MDKTQAPKRENLITPEAACQIWAEWLPDAPESGTALLRRTERGNGPPCHMVDGPGTRKRLYHPHEVVRWCIAQQPTAPRLLLAALFGDAKVLFKGKRAGLYLFPEKSPPQVRVALDEGLRLETKEATS